MKRGIKFIPPDETITAMVQSGQKEALNNYHQLLIEHGHDPDQLPANRYDFNRGFEYGIQWALDNLDVLALRGNPEVTNEPPSP
jgi:hypothetical protein